MDTLTKKERSVLMSKIRSKNTMVEVQIRKFLWGLGYRYRLHRKDLPGTPDIVFPSKFKVVLVHGCFWHGHKCRKDKLPKTRKKYWSEKIERNKKRDSNNLRKLKRLGWKPFTIWECQRKDEKVLKKLIKFLSK
ncbi:DNA mismatch endonuclease Vsr [Nitrospina sp. Nb-3]|uniref:DNA mismatch endonuclease Vsr n=1 Tax=Nitrospina sp. Nb-3 TaxID=2940485 RepID=UPI0005AAE488